MSILTRLVDAISTRELPAYLPGRAPNACNQAHAVVTDGGRIREGRTTGRRVVYVTVYVPEARPGDLAETLAQVADAAAQVRELRQTGNVSESFFDNDKKAFAATAEFAALCGL